MKSFKKYRPALQNVVKTLPLAVPASIAVFGVLTILFLVNNKFYPEIIWPFGTGISLLVFWLIYRKTKGIKRPGSSKEQLICDLLVVFLVFGWVVFNGIYTSQHVYTNRDPAIYAVTGAWLTEHDSLDIPKVDNVFGNNASVQSHSAGFGDSPVHNDRIFSQGMHLLPAFLGLVGSIVGIGAMLHTNVIFGGTALLALYGFARFLARPRWALVATAGFSLTLPLIHFSRDTYTEPLTATFAFGALGLLWAAQLSRSSVLWFLAGITAGAGVLARIDAYLVLIGIAVSLVIYNILIEPNKRKGAIKNSTLFIIGALICIMLAWIDITRLSDGYYASQKNKIIPEILLLGLIAFSGFLAILISWKTRILSFITNYVPNKLPLIAAATVLFVGVLLASRPLWHESYRTKKSADLITGVTKEALQRNYHEQSFNWLTWYIGPVSVLLGFVGLAAAAYIIIRKRNMLLLTGFIVIFSISTFFLLKPSIASDQIWASRRLLPVIMPGMLAFSVIVLEYLHRQKKTIKFGISGEALTASLATLIIVTPLFISYPFLRVRTLVPQLKQINDICSRLPDNGAILWVGEASRRAVQPTRTICNIPSAGIDGKLENDDLKLIEKSTDKSNRRLFIGVFAGHKDTLPKEVMSEMRLISSIETKNLNKTFIVPPRHVVTGKTKVFIGEIK